MPQRDRVPEAGSGRAARRAKHADYVLDVNPYYEDSVFNGSWASNLDQALRGKITFEQLVENIEKECNTAISRHQGPRAAEFALIL